MSGLLSVSDALSRILAEDEDLDAEDVPLGEAAGRILAADLTANRDQPAFDASAMDGYALRAADLDDNSGELTVVGESAAGHPFAGEIGQAECARIFTGARIPDGADTIAIQENAQAKGATVFIDKAEKPGRYIRRAGLDFRAGDVLLREGMKLSPARLSLAASMGLPTLPVRKRPKVAIIASGDELVAPGEAVPEGGIVSSNNLGIAAIVKGAGGEPVDLGIAKATRAALADMFAQAANCDVVVTSGGASVGDHDLVRPVLQDHGVELDFWKIAMRPGTPLNFGRKGTQRYLGLPGNPAAAMVCFLMYAHPAIRRLAGEDWFEPMRFQVVAGFDMKARKPDRREFLRGRLSVSNGATCATKYPRDGSGLISSLRESDGLIELSESGAAVTKGQLVDFIPFSAFR